MAEKSRRKRVLDKCGQIRVKYGQITTDLAEILTISESRPALVVAHIDTLIGIIGEQIKMIDRIQALYCGQPNDPVQPVDFGNLDKSPRY